MKKIIFTGGGTGGHIYPNLAIMDLLKNQYKIVYIGSKNSKEEKLVSPNYKFYGIDTVKLIRSLTPKNLLIPFKLLKSIHSAKQILKTERPDLIFSKGGFVSLPVVFAGNKLGIPCITHESDFSLGLANKLIKNKCQYVMTSFEPTSKNLKNGICTGSPIRKEILTANKEKFYSKYSIDGHKKNLLIMCGSLGSKTVNNYILHNLKALTTQFNVFHIVGNGNLSPTKMKNYYQIEYASDIQNLIAGADIVITRGGSNSLFELLSLKKPILIIPLSKKQSRGDQILNANYLHSLQVANTLYEEDFENVDLISKINQTIKNKDMYIKNMKKLQICGNDNIINIIKNVLS